MLYLLIAVKLLTFNDKTGTQTCDQSTAVEFTVDAAKAQDALNNDALVYQIAGTGIKRLRRVARYEVTAEDVAVSRAPDPKPAAPPAEAPAKKSKKGK